MLPPKAEQFSRRCREKHRAAHEAGLGQRAVANLLFAKCGSLESLAS